jgi:hypothetical protein
VSVRIYDPNNTLFGQDVLFSVKNPVRLEMELYWWTVQDSIYVEDGEAVPDWLKERSIGGYDGSWYYEDGLLLNNYSGELIKKRRWDGLESG